MSKKKVILTAIVILIVVLVGFAIITNRNGDETIQVQTAGVERQKIVETVTATGRIQPKTDVKISADVAAKITKLPVNEGDWVEKGKFLVQLDRERFSASVERAEANASATLTFVNILNG